MDKNDKPGKFEILNSNAYTLIATVLKSDGCCAAFLRTELTGVMMSVVGENNIYLGGLSV
jgi:hypothetical protein